MKTSPPPDRRKDYPHFLELQTRWNDNDVYGHVNNVVYYSYFDTLINRWLVEEGGLDIEKGSVIGVCVESQCRYLGSLAFPERVDGGLRVGKLGETSVRYELGIFRWAADEPSAVGRFVHVFVDRATRQPVPIPQRIRTSLETLLVHTPASHPAKVS